MIDRQPSPPRTASLLLQALMRPEDAESVPGDLIEEYREVRRPSLGRLRADVWYVTQVLSVLLRYIWPGVLAIVVLRLLFFPLPRAWNLSLVPAPGVTLLDAAVFVAVGYFGARRTGRLITGIITAGTTSLLGFAAFLVYAAVTRPSLLRAPFENPFIFVILATLLLIALGFGMAGGVLGAAAGKWRSVRSVRL